MSASRDAAFSNALDDHLSMATDLAHALLMMACSEMAGGDQAERSALNTLAGEILRHHAAINEAWDAWSEAGGFGHGKGEGAQP